MRSTINVREMPSKPTNPSVLAISPDEHDFEVLRRMIDPAWTLLQAPSVLAALDAIGECHPVAVLCDTESRPGTWRDLLGHTAHSPDAPRLIVTSRLADETLWAEVLNLGAYDVLAKPFEAEEVCRILGMACRQWANTSRSPSVRVANA